MKSLTFDQYRRQIRRELFLKRQQDNDHSEARLFSDGKKLDTLLVAAGYILVYSSEWSKHFDEMRHLQRLEEASQRLHKGSQTHLNPELILLGEFCLENSA